MKKLLWSLVLILLALVPRLLWAADELPAQQVLEQHSANSQAFTWLLVKMIFSLLLVCALAVVILRVILPRLMGMPMRSGGLVRVVYRTSLEPKKSLYVVQIAGGYHLLGVSDGSVTHLMDLPADKVDAALDDMKKPIAGIKPFWQILQDKKDSAS